MVMLHQETQFREKGYGIASLGSPLQGRYLVKLHLATSTDHGYCAKAQGGHFPLGSAVQSRDSSALLGNPV